MQDDDRSETFSLLNAPSESNASSHRSKQIKRLCIRPYVFSYTDKTFSYAANVSEESQSLPPGLSGREGESTEGEQDFSEVKRYISEFNRTLRQAEYLRLIAIDEAGEMSPTRTDPLTKVPAHKASMRQFRAEEVAYGEAVEVIGLMVHASMWENTSFVVNVQRPVHLQVPGNPWSPIVDLDQSIYQTPEYREARASWRDVIERLKVLRRNEDFL